VKPLTIAVTGLNATDSPAPGVPVIRAIREGAGKDCRIVGLAYDPLDAGNYIEGIADHVFLMPYPSLGAEAMFDRIAEIHERYPIDAVLPTLDAELPHYMKLLPRFESMGIRAFLPLEDQLKLRSKARLHELKDRLGIEVPKGVVLHDTRLLPKLDEMLGFPLMVKGQYYEAYIAYSPMEVEGHFHRLQAKWGLPIVLQEYVAGEEFDVVALGDGQGGMVGSVAMRKMQLTEKGKAWGGVTVSDPPLDAFVADAMAKLRWRGPCELELMKAKDDGRYSLLEINPRFPAWVYLAVGAGRNLPWATVLLAMGETVPAQPPAPSGIMFLRYSFDQICRMSDYESLTTLGELHVGDNA
jgi:carbamoyl-phosphate synthase large subunit